MINGVAVGFLAYGLFSTADASIKALGGSMSVFEIIFLVTAAHFLTIGVAIAEGPDERGGATGPILSVYFRDPDGNLVEVSNLL